MKTNLLGKLVSFIVILTSGSIFTPTAIADIGKICGKVSNSRQFAESDLNRVLDEFKSKNKIALINTLPTHCWADEIMNLCEACATVFYKPILSDAPPDGIIIDPRKIVSHETIESAESLIETHCDGYTFCNEGLQVEIQNHFKGACTDKLKVEHQTIQALSEETTFTHEVGVQLLLENGDSFTLGPITETRNNSSFNPSENHLYRNAQIAANQAIDTLVKNAKLNFITEDKRCYRILLVLPKEGSTPSLNFFEKKLYFDCNTVELNTLVSES